MAMTIEGEKDKLRNSTIFLVANDSSKDPSHNHLNDWLHNYWVER